MYKILLIILLSFSFPVNLFQGQLLSNEDYITGDDGVVRMYVNVTGHVRNPGTYLAYDTIDFMSMLSLAGGYLKGANLSKILIISKDGQKTKIDLNQIFDLCFFTKLFNLFLDETSKFATLDPMNVPKPFLI